MELTGSQSDCTAGNVWGRLSGLFVIDREYMFFEASLLNTCYTFNCASPLAFSGARVGKRPALTIRSGDVVGADYQPLHADGGRRLRKCDE